MAIDLINITNIVLVNDFETWLKRTNEVIDALNPLQIYDLDDTGVFVANPLFVTEPLPAGFSLGIQYTRDRRFDGDMQFEVNANPPLGFDPTTGALELSFTGPFAPPLLTGTPCGGVNAIANDDLFLVEDVSSSTTKMVAAENMLPPTILCDHSFGDGITPVTISIEGDLVVTGTQTILNTTTVQALDPKIDLNAADALTLTDASNYVSGEDLIPGETVTGVTSSVTATVFSWTPAAIGNPGSILVVTNPSGTFTADEVITGNTSTFSITDDTTGGNPPVAASGVPAGDDSVAGGGIGGGLCLLSTDGNKNFTWTVADNRWHISSTDAGDRGFQIDSTLSLFTRTIEPLTNQLDIIGSGTGEALSVHWHEAGEDDHWRFMLREFSTGQVAYTLGSYPVGGDTLNDDGVFVLQHSTANDAGPVFDIEIFFDSVTPTHDASIFGFARNLNADLLDGCHSSETPTPFFIPCADAAGQIDPGWITNTGNIKKNISQTAHGLVKGNVVRPDPSNADEYILAQANNLVNAESVGIVSDVPDPNNFELTLLGCVSGLDVVASHASDHTATPAFEGAAVVGGLDVGKAYFLSIGKAGSFTTELVPGGSIQKTVFIATSSTDVIIVNYVGGVTDVVGATPVIELTNDVLGLSILGSPIVTSIVERTARLIASGGTLPLNVQKNDNTGAGNRTFEIEMQANTILQLLEPGSSPVDPVTNSVTLIITQDGTGGWIPNITISGVGPNLIHWDNSVSQPLVQPAPNKTTIYVLINVNDIPGVWYGSRAVFQI